MHIFKQAWATTLSGRLFLDFYLSDDFMDFAEAKKVADASFLEQQVQELHRALKNNLATTILLTRESAPKSYLRGYQGGLLQVVGNKIIVPRRGLDAPSSPGKLDICAGRTVCKDEGDWLGLILAEGFEEVAKYDGTLYVPHVTGIYRGYAPLVQKRVLETAREAGIDFSTVKGVPVQIIKPENAAKVRIHLADKHYTLEFEAGWCALPNLSSIELFLYSRHIGLPQGIAHIDTECDYRGDKKLIVDREIFEIDKDTGNVTVWKNGKVLAYSTIGNALAEAKNNPKLDDPVSPKLKAAIQNWPEQRLGPRNFLEVLLEC
jgi:hypothetical protein